MTRVVLVTGVMAAGKSTIAQALAARFERSVHLRGDVFRRMIVRGNSPPNTPAFETELRLRYSLAAAAADTYADAGYTVVWQDVVIGLMLGEIEALVYTRPFDVFVLAPTPGAVAAREDGRPKRGYGAWTVEGLDAVLRNDTPAVGTWIDSTDQTVDETVATILTSLR